MHHPVPEEERFMARWRATLAFAVALTLAFGSALGALARPGTPEASSLQVGDRIPGRYIVVLNPGVEPAGFAAAQGLRPDAVYRHAINGFAVNIPAQAAQALAANPNVAFVEQDGIMGVTLEPEDVPTGIARIGTLENTTAAIDGNETTGAKNIDVAVLDTGIANHNDLNRAGGAGFAGSGFAFFWTCDDGTASFDDGHGHGTHVAGTIAAKDNGPNVNGRHVVGVVPGARVWAVKVLTNSGSGAISCIINGVDWVTQMKTSGQIDFAVANMSLGGGNSAALCTAVNNSVNKGVVYAVAAGNSAQDAANTSPANCSGVVTVSAIADFDGQPGGLKDTTVNFSSCTQTKDDHFACFSNFGATIEVAAPGVSILSTVLNNGYQAFSGTSMAAPHVAGAVALYKLAGGSISNAHGPTLISQMTAAGWTVPQGSACGFTGDPDSHAEPLIYVGSSCHGEPPPPEDDDPPTVTVTSPTAGATVSGTVTVSAEAADDNGVTKVEFFASGASIGLATEGPGGTWSLDWYTTTVANGAYTIAAVATDTANQTTTSSGVTVTVENEGSEPPPPDGTMHVAALSGASVNNGSTWTANVTITIRDSTGALVSGATVTGSWSGGASGSDSCTTNGTGTCTVSVSGILKRTGSVTWTVSDVTHLEFEYAPGSNTANSIVVSKP
jgi:subtilisin